MSFSSRIFSSRYFFVFFISHFFVQLFFRICSFAFQHFFVLLFFRSIISSSNTIFVHPFFRNMQFFVHAFFRLRFSPNHSFVHYFLPIHNPIFRLFTCEIRCKYVSVYYSNVQRTFKDGKIKWTVFTRPHTMKRRKSISPMLRNRDLSFWTPDNFEVEYFLNEETEGVLTDTVI